MKSESILPLSITAIAAVGLAWWIFHAWTAPPRAEAAGAAQSETPGARTARASSIRIETIETTHYRIESSASRVRAQQVGAAVESFHDAYVAFFAKSIPAARAPGKHRLRLYRDQAEFKAKNRSRPWAEAYYLRPICHAYDAIGEVNPYHWMVHEATHQLNAELAGFPKHKWVEEGLGTYFGASRIENGKLTPGSIDPDAYPIWWLGAFVPSGDLDGDLANGRWIPLRALITGEGGPQIDSNVNLYYVQYWSLSHFLFHGENGRYAEAYKRLIAEGGTLENFERLIGPVERIERERYAYLHRGLKPRKAR